MIPRRTSNAKKKTIPFDREHRAYAQRKREKEGERERARMRETRRLLAAQLSSLEIAGTRAVMDICHGADTRYRALPPTKKRRGGIIDDVRAQR